MERRGSFRAPERKGSMSLTRIYEVPKDRRVKKEEDKLIALLHPTTKARIEHLFDQGGHETVTTEELLSYLDSLQEIQDFEGINYNTGLVHKFMEEQEDFTVLPRRGSLVVVGRFISEARKHSDRIRREDRTEVATGKVRYVGALQYLRLMATCALKDKRYTHRWRGLPTIDPKASLVLIVVVMTAIMSVAIIGVLGLIHMPNVLDEASDSLRDSATGFDRLVRQLPVATSNAFESATAATARDMSPLLQAAAHGVSDAATAATRHGDEKLIKLMELEERLAVHSESRRLAAHLEAARLRLNLLGESLVEMHAALLAELGGDSNTSVAVVELRPIVRAVYASERCTGCPEPTALRCVTALANASVGATHLGEERDMYMNRNAATASVLLSTNLVVCAMRPTILLRTPLIALLRDMASRLVSADNSVAASRTVYLRIAGEPMAAGGLHQLTPALEAPLPVLAFLETAVEFESGVWVDDAAQVAWSHALAVLPATEMLVLTCTRQSMVGVSTSIAVEAHRALDAVLPALVVRPSLFLQQPDGELVALRGNDSQTERRSAAASSPIVLALHGQSGAMRANDGELTPVLSGYSAVRLHQQRLALVMERPTRTLKGAADTAIRDVFAHARHISPNDRRIDAYAMAPDGLLRHVLPGEPPAAPGGFAEHCWATESSGELSDPSTPDTGRELRFCVYNVEQGLVIVASINRWDVERRMWVGAGYGVAVGAALSVLALLVIRQLTKHVLDHIERDYVTYKAQIEDEKRQFSELVKDVMPSYISKRIMAGEKLIVDQHPQLTFLFSDIVGFTEVSRKMSTTEMVRLLGYMFMVEDGVAEHYDVHKIKTIGDAYFCVAGLDDAARRKRLKDKAAAAAAAADGDGTVHSDDGAGDAKPLGSAQAGNTSATDPSGGDDADEEVEKKLESNQVYRMVAFACTLQLINSRDFTHRPERTDCFKQLAGDSDPGPFHALSMRMGIHSGPAIAGVVDVGRAPHFDAFGPSVNLASRMESTAPIDRIQLSSPTHEFLLSLGTKDIFEFDPPRKTLVKGYGTIKTHTIKATSLTVPDELLHKLRIERAVTRKVFGELGLGSGSVEGGGSHTRSASESLARSSARGSSIAEQDVIRDEPTPKSAASGGMAGKSAGLGLSGRDLSPPSAHAHHSGAAVAPHTAAIERSQPVALPPPPALPSMFGTLPSIPQPL